MITRASGVPKSMNETHDPEICRSSRSGGGQTSFYVTSWDNRHSEAASRLPSAVASRCGREENEEREKKRIVGEIPRYLHSPAIRSAIKAEQSRVRDIDVSCRRRHDGYYLRNYLTDDHFCGDDRWQSGLRASRVRVVPFFWRNSASCGEKSLLFSPQPT